jgi:hypothetical protein
MKRINNSNFETLEDIIKTIDFNYNPQNVQNIEEMQKYWVSTVGEKISKLAKVLDYSADNILTVCCADSFISNELYLEKDTILKKMNIKVQETGIIIKDIKFDYKKWERKNNG